MKSKGGLIALPAISTDIKMFKILHFCNNLKINFIIKSCQFLIYIPFQLQYNNKAINIFYLIDLDEKSGITRGLNQRRGTIHALKLKQESLKNKSG